MSGGDFLSRSEAQVCSRRRIEDRIDVVRDLRRVEKHLGAIAAADQLGLPVGGIETICNRKAAISQALLTAMYGAGGARLLPTLVPREAIDAQVDKILAAAGARAVKSVAVAKAVMDGPSVPPFDKLKAGGPLAVATPATAKVVSVAAPLPPVAAPAPAKPAPGPVVGTRDRDAHECKVLAEVGTTRPALVAILQRARKAYGTWNLAGEALGIGSSSIQNLAGNHAKFSFRTASLLLDWDKVNPVTALRQAQDERDAARVFNDVGDSADRGADEEAPSPESFKQDAAAAGAAVVVEASDMAAAAAASSPAVADRGDAAAFEHPPAQNSTAALSVEPHPPGVVADLPCAAVDGAAAESPPPRPPLTAANDDPFAVALTALVTARDAAQAARAAIGDEIAALDGQIGPLSARRAALEADEARLIARISVLFDCVDQFQAVAK